MAQGVVCKRAGLQGRVPAHTTVQPVVARATREGVIARTAKHHVVPGIAEHLIIAPQATHDVIAAATMQHVVVDTQNDPLVLVVPNGHVLTGATDHAHSPHDRDEVNMVNAHDAAAGHGGGVQNNCLFACARHSATCDDQGHTGIKTCTHCRLDDLHHQRLIGAQP
ncbi:hypothetical protein D3C72_1784760 [compost metagenome]